MSPQTRSAISYSEYSNSDESSRSATAICSHLRLHLAGESKDARASVLVLIYPILFGRQPETNTASPDMGTNRSTEPRLTTADSYSDSAV